MKKVLKIAEVRKSRNMTQMELAKVVGIAQPTLCNIENGENNPSLDTFIKIAQALECSLDDLVDAESVASYLIGKNHEGIKMATFDGNDLKRWREEHRISAADLAERISVDVSTLYRNENGKIFR